MTGADYEARILYALCSSECMLVVCGKEEYLNTPWVKNEYSRFLALIRDEEKASDSITLAFFGKPIEKLHGKNGRIQGIDLGAMDATERVTAFVEAHTPEAKKRREAEEKAKRAAEAELKKRLEEQQRAQREIEEQLKNLRKNAAVSSAPVSAGANITSLLVRAKQELDFGDYGAAAKYYGQAIDADPENGEAWFGAFLCEQKVKSEEELLKDITLEKIKAIRANKNYLFAVKNAAGELKTRLEKFAETLNDREQTLRTEQAERERKAREEEETKKEEKRKRYEWEKINDPSIDNYDPNEFEIQGQTLIKYKGTKHDVKIPRGITKIENDAFWYCSGLTSIMIPNSVMCIGDFAFYHCNELTSITIGNGMTSIGMRAFDGCSRLTSITVANGNTKYLSNGNCLIETNSKTLILGCKDSIIPSDDSVTSIGKHAFRGCNGLTSITIPNSVTGIGSYAFDGCSSLTSITIPKRFKKTRKKIFKGCKKIKFTYTE